jgi:hypothetical protein
LFWEATREEGIVIEIRREGIEVLGIGLSSNSRELRYEERARCHVYSAWSYILVEYTSPILKADE